MTRADSPLLMIPGPVSIEDDILASLGGPVIAHYGTEWTELYLGLVRRLQEVLGTSGDVHLLFGPGSAALEMCIASPLGPGDEILIPSNGFFGDRLIEIARAHRLNVVTTHCEPREPISIEAVRSALAEHQAIRAVAIVHHETSLGVMNPVREVAELARSHGALMLVDAVSSAGGTELEVDAWGIDLCVTVANKCLGGPVGVAPVLAGPRAMAAMAANTSSSAGWYLNLATWGWYREAWGSWHPHPTTMPTNVIAAFDLAVERLLAGGLKARFARQFEIRDRLRSRLSDLGFEMLVADGAASPITTAALVPPGLDVAAYMSWLLERGIRIAGGIGEFAGRAVRVGHMGRASEERAIERYLDLTAEYLESAAIQRP